MYSIDTIDHARRRITTSIDGFVTPADIVALGVDTRAAVRSLGLGGSTPHDLLYDLTNTMVASRETIGEIGTIMRNPMYKHLWARHIAFVTTSALLRMQMERVVAGRPDLQIFDTRQAAETWLDMSDTAPSRCHEPLISPAD